MFLLAISGTGKITLLVRILPSNHLDLFNVIANRRGATLLAWGGNEGRRFPKSGGAFGGFVWLPDFPA
jgi:hypothetical protein